MHSTPRFKRQTPYILDVMETRAYWGPVVVAGCIAVALIVGTYFYVTREVQTPSLIDGVRVAPAPQEVHTEWRAALDALARPAQATGPYRAPTELPTSESISRELVAAYAALKSGESTNTDAAITDIVTRNVVVLAPTDTYTLATVATSKSVTLEEYARVVGNALERSAQVREYELSVFARTISKSSTAGTPALAASAALYRSIEHELARTLVPPPLADEHLTVLKGIAFLAYSTELMAEWSGDPVDALSYVDGFIKAERELKSAFNALFSAMIELGKTT